VRKKLRGGAKDAILILALGLTLAAAPALGAHRLTINDVTVVPMTGAGKIIAHARVQIDDGRITAITSAAGSCAAPCLDGHGKWLIPGLTDAHVHIENDRLAQLFLHLPRKPPVAEDGVFLPYIANGVTQVFDLSAMTETFVQKADIAAGRVLGPHIITAAMLDGAKPYWPEGMSHGIPNPEAGRQAVRDAHDDGYDLIKVYSLLDLPTFLAIVDEAKTLGMKVIGHIPGRAQDATAKYLVPGFDAVAHAEEYAYQTPDYNQARIPGYAALARANGTALVTTLTVDDRILEETEHPESLKQRPELVYEYPLLQMMVLYHNPYVAQASPAYIGAQHKITAFNRALVKAFAAAGVPVLAGTESPVPGVVPGFALHDELVALVRAGLTPYQALYASTTAPCNWLGTKDCGTVEVGRRADLLLLDGDPIRDIANTNRISAVILGGQVHSAAELANKMAALKARNLAALKAAHP
jgi:imidazolonepropionase-like amidohydrolase